MTPVLLVHGAWHGSWSWAALQAELDRRGVPSFAVELPGHGLSPEPLGDLHGDARCVVDAIERIGHDVVLVGHSYGGAVVGQAAMWTEHVRHLVFVAAFVLDEGDSMRHIGVLDGVPEEPPSLLGDARSRLGDVLLLDPIAAIPALYGCAPAPVQDAAVARLGPQPVASFVQAVTGSGWSRFPATYVRCADDRCVPLSHQDAMAARCGTVYTLHTDHSPMLSAAGDLADIIAEVARLPSR
jgi:pimeloyl-ACP methyl ester carboxylesterase